jgi:predicted nucleotide-binding protein
MLKDRHPVLFIGSSNERLAIAEVLHSRLSNVSEPQTWKHGAFPLGEGTLETLERHAVTSDFAVLVATPDDLVERRGKPARMPRDNILFELGLFIGTLGRKRTFIVCNQGFNLLPTNLLGITVCFFSDPTHGTLANALASAAAQIEHRVEELGFRTEHSGRLLEGRWKYHITDAGGGHEWGGEGEILVDRRNPIKVTIKGTRTWDRKGKAPCRRIACD